MNRRWWLIPVLLLQFLAMPWTAPAFAPAARAAGCCSAETCCCRTMEDCPCAPAQDRQPTRTPTATKVEATLTVASKARAAAKPVSPKPVIGLAAIDAGMVRVRASVVSTRMPRGPPERDVLCIWTT